MFSFEVGVLFGDVTVLVFVKFFCFFMEEGRFLFPDSGDHCHLHAGFFEPDNFVDRNIVVESLELIFLYVPALGKLEDLLLEQGTLDRFLEKLQSVATRQSIDKVLPDLVELHPILPFPVQFFLS